jgi:hypothetical protein
MRRKTPAAVRTTPAAAARRQRQRRLLTARGCTEVLAPPQCTPFPCWSLFDPPSVCRR